MISKRRYGPLIGGLVIALTAVCMGLVKPMWAQSRSAAMATDAEIAAAVEKQYLRDAAVPLVDIEVFADNGIVTLDGEVATLIAREQAEEIAGIVRGVRSVVNRIRLAPTVKSMEQVETEVADALRASRLAESYQIDVTVNERARVLLTGSVDSWAEREHVERIAMSVPGVMEVSNLLSVMESTIPRGPSEITAEIEARLRWDVRVDDSLVNVLVLDGSRVVLSGTVGSLAEKRHAQRLARVAGVRDVTATQLVVEPWARNPDLRRAALNPMGDDDIREAVVMALRYDPRVLEEQIDVQVSGGVVELTGDVESVSARRAAEQDAMNTAGVLGVQNSLELNAGLRDDAAIARLIENALQAYGLTEANDIGVAVDNGQVRLTGDVHTASAHWQAEEVAMAVRGVVMVRNQLTINGQQPVLLTRLYGFDPELDRMIATDEAALPTDREIYEQVESELYWSPFVDSDRVTISVDDGAVTLTGAVESAREYQAAQVNAYQGGALSVDNELVLSF